jgi:hypothetical protein
MNKKEKIKFLLDDLFVKINLNIIAKGFSNNYVGHVGDIVYSGHNFIKNFPRQNRLAISDI